MARDGTPDRDVITPHVADDDCAERRQLRRMIATRMGRSPRAHRPNRHLAREQAFRPAVSFLCSDGTFYITGDLRC
jgi:hypothetical protein